MRDNLALKQKLQVVVVAVACVVAFSTIMIKMTDVWPCELLEMLKIPITFLC